MISVTNISQEDWMDNLRYRSAMLARIQEFINKYNMILPQDTVVVGVSGGADSVCLLILLKELQQRMDFSIVAVHINHCIRGEEADLDQEFSRELCNRLEIEFKLFTIEVENIAKIEKISVEEAGRKSRYKAFQEVLLDAAGPDSGKIAVAHHMDDQGETILMNMLRGSGIKGVAGIQPVRGNIIRPLLCLRRSEIEHYLMNRGQSFQTDSTNLCNDYTRNRLRNIIFPYFEENVNIHSVENICAMAQVLSEAENYIEGQALKAKDKCVSINAEKMYMINIDTFKAYDIIIKKYVIRKILAELSGQSKDIYKVHVGLVLELENKTVGNRVDLSYSITAKREYSHISIHKKKDNTKNNLINHSDPINIVIDEGCNKIEINEKIYVKEMSFINLSNIEILKTLEIKEIEENDYTKVFDYDKIKFNLEFRTRRTGDYIQINKNGGNKKLKDFFIDHKVPKDCREKVLLLADGSNILWIVGYRMSEGYKINNSTKNILKIKIY